MLTIPALWHFEHREGSTWLVNQFPQYFSSNHVFFEASSHFGLFKMKMTSRNPEETSSRIYMRALGQERLWWSRRLVYSSGRATLIYWESLSTTTHHIKHHPSDFTQEHVATAPPGAL